MCPPGNGFSKKKIFFELKIPITVLHFFILNLNNAEKYETIKNNFPTSLPVFLLLLDLHTQTYTHKTPLQANILLYKGKCSLHIYRTICVVGIYRNSGFRFFADFLLQFPKKSHFLLNSKKFSFLLQGTSFLLVRNLSNFVKIRENVFVG